MQTSVAKMSQNRIIIDYSIDIERKKIIYHLTTTSTSKFANYTKCGFGASNRKYFCYKTPYY